MSRPTSGTGQILGKNIAQFNSIQKNRSKIAYIPEILNFDNDLTGNILWNYLFRLRFNETNRLSEMYNNFLTYIKKFGLITWLDTPLGGYSNGMRKRILLALWMSFEPELFLLDEFDSGIDQEGLEIIKSELAEIKATVIAVSHNPEFMISENTITLQINDLKE